MRSGHSVYRTRGAAVLVGLLVAFLLLGGMVLLNLSAMLTVANTSRAFDTARQNLLIAHRLQRAAQEAVQECYGVSVEPSRDGLEATLRAAIAAAPQGAFQVTRVSVASTPTLPLDFPQLGREPTPLADVSPAFLQLAGPQLRRWVGPRAAETETFRIFFSFSRNSAPGRDYNLAIDCRVTTVPLTRFGITAYDLPSEIGLPLAAGNLPHGEDVQQLAPLGLVPGRDPAQISTLSSGNARPGYYRAAAVVAEAYQYLFSQYYLQAVTDYAGPTHFVQLDGGPGGPDLEGGTRVGNDYTLDIGRFGKSRLGGVEATRNFAVISSASGTYSISLSDSGVSDLPALLLLAGPANAAEGPMRVHILSSLNRPVILIGYHVELSTTGPVVINGALFLDPTCRLRTGGSSFTAGHLSYSQSSDIDVSLVRLRTLPQGLEALAPRVRYVATAKTFL